MLIDYLRSFILTAEFNSLTKAAKVLDTNIYKVRNDIIKLEKEMGTTFFTRGKYTYLTKEGRIAYKHFVDVLKCYNEMEVDLNRLQSNNTRSLYITITPILYMLKLYDKLDFSDVCDNLIQVLSSHEDNYNKLIHDEVDFTFLCESDRRIRNKTLNSIPIATNNICFLVSKKDELSKTANINLNTISNKTILYDESHISPKMKTIIAKLSKANTITATETNNFFELLNQNTNYILLWYNGDINKELSTSLHVVNIEKTTETVCLVYKKDYGKDEDAEKIADLFIKHNISRINNI